jgi:hypothetical protein
MPDTRSRRLACLGLVLAFALLSGAAKPKPAPAPAPVPRFIDSPISRKVVNLLVAGDSLPVVRALTLPPDYTKEQTDSERTALNAMIGALLRAFGKPRDVKAIESGLRFYEIAIFGGPTPFWWEKDGSREHSRQYFYEADFASHGTGYIKVITRTGDGPEAAVAVAFCLPADRSPSRVRMRTAFNAVLDAQGAPPNHPARKVDLPVFEVPQAKAR